MELPDGNPEKVRGQFATVADTGMVMTKPLQLKSLLPPWLQVKLME
ncbi:hypothetical protein [Comamonas serinivorans]|nr:hypothetical protein [Comamonas serinivorans]